MSGDDKEPSNINVMEFHATALRQVADELQQSLNQVARTRPSGGDVAWMTKATGYLSSALILRALATEFMLKVLSFRKTGKYRTDRKGHDLLVLFNDLDSETKQLIRNLEGTHGIAPLEQILKKHRSDFVDWRYPLTKTNQVQADLMDLDKALGILTEAARIEATGGP